MGKLTPEALLIAASGIVIVFLVLAALCFLIPITSRLVRAFAEDPFSSQQSQQTQQTKPTAEQSKPAPAPVQEAARPLRMAEKSCWLMWTRRQQLV